MIRKTLIAILLLSLNVTFAQIKEGYIKYNIDYSADSPEMEMAASMMKNSTMEIYFDESKTKVNIQMPGMYSVTTVVNDSSNEVLMLFEIPMMGQKKYVKSTVDEIEKFNDNQNDTEKTEIQYLDDTKEIHGYKCKKAIIVMNDVSIIYWYTEDIKVNTAGQDNFNSDLPGHPLEFETKADGLTIKFTTSDLNDKISLNKEKLFNTGVPEGFDQTTFEEISKGAM